MRAIKENMTIADVGKHSVINKLYGAVVSLDLGLAGKNMLPWIVDLGFKRPLGNWHVAIAGKLKKHVVQSPPPMA